MRLTDFEPLRLDELAPATLASYKTKAGAAATAADAAGDVKTADKRFSGIVKATKKQFDQDAKGVAEGEYDSRKPFGVRYKVFAGREGRMTTREYWTSSEEKLQRAVDKIQALDNFYEIDGYSYPKESQGVAEGSGESYIIVRTNSEGKKDVFAGNFDTYERAQKELDACLAHPLHTKYKQKFEIKRKGGEQGVAEGPDDTVRFEVDSENAYNHVMDQFGSVIDWDGDTMVAPRKYWGAIQELALAASGEASEEQGVAEGLLDTVKKIGKKLVKPVEVPGLNQMKDIHNTAHKREIDAQNKKYAPKGVSEGSIKDVEAKIRAHDQRKADREQEGDPYVAHELHSHNVIRKQLLDKRKRAQAAYQKKMDSEGVSEGVAETVSMDQAKKVLRHYGADHFKTTTNELHFYKNGRPMSVDLIFNDDATRSVNLSQLNSATRRLKGQGVAKGQQIDEVFADQGSGSTDRDNADYMKRRNAAKKAGYTGRETKAGTWRVFKDGNAVAAAGPFKSADEAAAWIKKHKQGITEMDKSEPSAGRDGGPRPGPDREAKPISAKKATKDAADMLNRAFQDSHKKKDVAEDSISAMRRLAGIVPQVPAVVSNGQRQYRHMPTAVQPR